MREGYHTEIEGYLRKSKVRLLAVVLMSLVLSGFSYAEVLNVAISNMRFNHNQLRIQQGDTVIWTNDEKRGYHTVLFSRGGVAAESPPLFPGETWQITLEQPGEYGYRCGPHPDMVGTVTVIGR